RATRAGSRSRGRRGGDASSSAASWACASAIACDSRGPDAELAEPPVGAEPEVVLETLRGDLVGRRSAERDDRRIGEPADGHVRVPLVRDVLPQYVERRVEI